MKTIENGLYQLSSIVFQLCTNIFTKINPIYFEPVKAVQLNSNISSIFVQSELVDICSTHYTSQNQFPSITNS